MSEKQNNDHKEDGQMIGKKKGIMLLTLSLAAGCAAFLGSRKRAVPYIQRRARRADPRKEALAEVAAGIREYADTFDGLYEGLYQAAHNQRFFSTDAYEEWCGRVGQLEEGPFREAFERLFSQSDVEEETLCREKYLLLLRGIDLAGITRERENNISCEADEAMCRAYVGADGQELRVGNVYTILKSAWVSGEKVIEYGMAAPGVLEA